MLFYVFYVECIGFYFCVLKNFDVRMILDTFCVWTTLQLLWLDYSRC